MTEDDNPEQILGIKGSPEDLRRVREMLGGLVGEGSNLEYVKVEPITVSPADIVAEAAKDLTELYRPDIEDAGNQAAIDQERIAEDQAADAERVDQARKDAEANRIVIDESQARYAEKLEQAKNGVERLKAFTAEILPDVHDDINTSSGVAKYQNGEEQPYIYTNRTYFPNITELGRAVQLNAFSVWGRHVNAARQKGVYDKHYADVYGSRQYEFAVTPAFILGKKYTDDGMVDVIFACPQHMGNIDVILDRADSGLERKGDHLVQEQFLYIARMTKDSYKELDAAMKARKNIPLPDDEQRAILDERTWPSTKSQPITIRRSIKGFFGTSDKSIDKNNSITIKLVNDPTKPGRLLTPEELMSCGGIEVFDVDPRLAELAVAMDKSEKFQELEREHSS